MLWRLRKWKAGKSPTPGPEDRNNHSLPQAFGSAMEVVPLGGGPELYDLAAEEKPLIPGEPRKILLVAHGETFDPEEIDYTVSLAARLGCNLVALNVGTPPRRSARFYPALGKSWQDSFKKRATAAAARLLGNSFRTCRAFSSRWPASCRSRGRFSNCSLRSRLRCCTSDRRLRASERRDSWA